MQVFTCDHHPVPLPPEHRFPMGKYAALRTRLLETGLLAPEEVRPAPAVEVVDLARVHERGYVARVLQGGLEPMEVRRIGFPWSPELVRRSLASVGGTVAASEAALDSSVAGNLAGGTHHAHRAFGSGYCVFNDIAVAARRLLDLGRVRRVVVFDVDVHQGDGTAAMFADDTRVFTCSIHGARNFPREKPAGDLDVALDDDTVDDEYLEVVRGALATALEAARPDVVFYQGGVDVLAEDRLGRLAVTRAGVFERDRRVFAELREHGVPVVLTLGGGYAEPIDATVEAHAGTYRAAREVFG